MCPSKQFVMLIALGFLIVCAQRKWVDIKQVKYIVLHFPSHILNRYPRLIQFTPGCSFQQPLHSTLPRAAELRAVCDLVACKTWLLSAKDFYEHMQTIRNLSDRSKFTCWVRFRICLMPWLMTSKALVYNKPQFITNESHQWQMFFFSGQSTRT